MNREHGAGVSALPALATFSDRGAGQIESRMLASRQALPGHVRLLLEILVSPARGASLSLDEWDVVVRSGRIARLLGTLHARFAGERLLDTVPPPVRAHLESSRALAAYRRQLLLHEMRAVAKVLEPLGVPMILLKGGAYLAQGLRCAEGRLPEDLDLMVPRDRLDEAERALVGAGWAFETTDAYDQRYYRAWSHELPPLRAPGHAIELDLHHTILPPTGRARPDARALVDAAVAIPDSPFRALSPADQVLHACAHLFQDSDCTERLRDLVDIDVLVREHAGTERAWAALLARARLHGLGRPLAYATRYCSAWLGTPIPDEVAAQLARRGPGPASRAAMDRLIERAILPHSPDEEPGRGIRLARRLLFVRSMWLRMPPWLLAYHALAKLVRGVRRGSRANRDG